MAEYNFSIIYIDQEHNVFQKFYPYSANCSIKTFLVLHKIYETYPELVNLKYGVFGKLQTPEYILQPNDRLEFYRNLQQDPKDLRKAKHKEQLRHKI